MIGLVLIALGVLFLLDTTGAVDGAFSSWWPLLLVLWGAGALAVERGRSIPGTLVLLLGVGFLLENLDVLGEDWLGRYWPVALIVVGAAFLLGAIGLRGSLRRRAPRGVRAGEDWLDATAVQAGRGERVTSVAWHGGRATAVLGGVEIDLRESRPAPEGAVLHTTAFMGGVEIKVPEEWEVVVHGTPFLGGFEDKTRPVRGSIPDGRPRLEVVGTAVMGGVEITN